MTKMWSQRKWSFYNLIWDHIFSDHITSQESNVINSQHNMTIEDPATTIEENKIEEEPPVEDITKTSAPTIDESFAAATIPSLPDTTSDLALAKDFAASLTKFGVDPKVNMEMTWHNMSHGWWRQIVSRFQESEFDRGWDFKDVDPEVSSHPSFFTNWETSYYFCITLLEKAKWSCMTQPLFSDNYIEIQN